MTQTETGIEGVVLDEDLTVSFTEFTHLCGANGRVVKLMVTEGLLRPLGQRPDEWRFSGIELRRARRALRLRRDLDLDLTGVALVLELVEELEVLRDRLQQLEQQFGSSAIREPQDPC